MNEQHQPTTHFEDFMNKPVVPVIPTERRSPPRPLDEKKRPVGMVFFLITWAALIAGCYGYYSGSSILFYVGAFGCLIANAGSKPLPPFISATICAVALTPWYEGAALGLILWTTIASVIGTALMAFAHK